MLESINTYLNDYSGIAIAVSIAFTLLVVTVIDKLISKGE